MLAGRYYFCIFTAHENLPQRPPKPSVLSWELTELNRQNEPLKKISYHLYFFQVFTNDLNTQDPIKNLKVTVSYLLALNSQWSMSGKAKSRCRLSILRQLLNVMK